MQVLTFSWATLSAPAYDSSQTEVGLHKCTVLYVEMSDVGSLVQALFYQPYLHGFLYFKTLNIYIYNIL